MKIKTGDKVRIIAGKDKGKEGNVLQVFLAKERVIVEGANIATRHLRGRTDASGQKVTFPSPIHVSNVKLIGPSGKGGRAGYTLVKTDGGIKKIRVIRSKGLVEEIV